MNIISAINRAGGSMFCGHLPFLLRFDVDPSMTPGKKNAGPVPSPEITVFQAKEIVTLGDEMPTARYVAVKDGKILAIAHDLEQMAGWLTPTNYKLDTQFKHDVLVPGFYESHTHVQMLGYSWRYPYVGRYDRNDPQGQKVAGCVTQQEVLERIKQAIAAAQSPEQTIIAWGYEPIFYKDGGMGVAELDGLSQTHPIIVVNINLHVAYANSIALRKAGIDETTTIAGFVRRDGKLTGEAQEGEALFTLYPLFPDITPEVLRQATQDVFNIAHRVGVTTMVDAAFGLMPHGYQAYQDCTHAHGNMRIIMYPFIEVIKRQDIQDKGGFAYVKQLQQDNDDWLKFGPVKIIIDGSMQAKTARLLWPFYLDGSNGMFNITMEDLKADLVAAFKEGLQVTMHANGDEAIEYALDATQYALNQVPRVDHRTRIEHLQIPHLAQIKRMQTLQMNASTLTNHIYYWGDDHIQKLLGYNRAQAMHPLKTLVEHNIPISLHSDVVSPINPLLAMWVAVNRVTFSGQPIGKQEALTPLQALKAVTLWAAYMQYEDHCKGSIEVGKIADFTVLGDNPLTVAPMKIKDIAVKATVVNGKVFPVE
jgi:predicted amidohydrolase YtcJ